MVLEMIIHLNCFLKVAPHTTPHTEAEIERVHSLVNKNKPEGSDRNRMDPDGLLSSMLGVKLGRPAGKQKAGPAGPAGTGQQPVPEGRSDFW